MEENKELTVNNLLQIGTPFNSKEYIEKIKSFILNGEGDPLAIYTVLKRMKKISETIFEDEEIKRIVNNEADKHLSGSKKSFNLYSATICKMAVHTFYDFSECNHPVLEQLYEIQKEVAQRIELIEEELKLLIPKDENKLGIVDDTKTIVVDKIPTLQWLENEDQVIVKAPRKIQKQGLKFMKI